MEQWQQILMARGNSINLFNDSAKIYNAFYEICKPILSTKGITLDTKNNELSVKDSTYTLTMGADGISIICASPGSKVIITFLIDENMKYKYFSPQLGTVYEKGQLLSTSLDYEEILNKIMNILVSF